MRSILRAILFAGIWLSLVGTAVGRVHAPYCDGSEQESGPRATQSEQTPAHSAHGNEHAHHHDHRVGSGEHQAAHGDAASQQDHADHLECDLVCVLGCALSSAQPPLPVSAYRAVVDATLLREPFPVTPHIPVRASPPYRPPRTLAL